MKKLVFLTDSGFWSHNLTLVEELNRRYNLTLFINYVKGFENHTKKIYCYSVKVRVLIYTLKQNWLKAEILTT